MMPDYYARWVACLALAVAMRPDGDERRIAAFISFLVGTSGIGGCFLCLDPSKFSKCRVGELNAA